MPPKADPDATAPLETGTSPSDSDSTDPGDKTVGSKPKSTRKASGKSAAPKAPPEKKEEGEQETERAETGTES